MARGIALLLLALFGASGQADGLPALAAGIEYEHLRQDALDAHVVRVELDQASLRIEATAEAERGLTVSTFAARTQAVVAINGDYFDADLQPIGLAMGDGRVWALPNVSVRRQEVVAVGDRRVEIIPRFASVEFPLPWMEGAVSGWPMVVEQCQPATKLPGSDHFTRAPHPRTAVGLSADGRKLFLVVVDGRREGVPGLTLAELAQLMADLGACTAVNLDGGGSSAMWVSGRIVNRPSDLAERLVANHIGVVLAEPDRPPAVREPVSDATGSSNIAGRQFESGRGPR